MAVADPQTYRWVPGVFVAAPTDLTAPPSCGGTQLGILADVVLKIVTGRHLVQYEEFGCPGEIIRTGEFWVIEAVLRGWDTDAVTKLFPGVYTGAVFGQTGGKQHPTAVRYPGKLAGDDAFKLLFVPDNYYEHEAIFIPRCVMSFAEEVSAALDLVSERSFAVEFIGLPEATLLNQIGLLRDLTIS
jgi:hypothetical protein